MASSCEQRLDSYCAFTFMRLVCIFRSKIFHLLILEFILLQLVNHVYFSPDGLWIASASFDKSVKLWNGVTGSFVAAFRGHVGPVYQIRLELYLLL